MMPDNTDAYRAISDLIAVYELGPPDETLVELVDPELLSALPARYPGVLTLEKLGSVIDAAVSAVDSADLRSTLRARWHAAKMVALASDDAAARCAAASNLTDDDFDDAEVMARFRAEVEHGSAEVVLCFAEGIAENLSDVRQQEVCATLTGYAEKLAADGSNRELIVVLQVLGTAQVRTRRPADPDILTRLARIAASSLIWEPEPAALCAVSISQGKQYDLLAQWLESSDPELGVFASWIVAKVASDAPSAGHTLKHALGVFISHWQEHAHGNERLAAAIERARALI